MRVRLLLLVLCAAVPLAGQGPPWRVVSARGSWIDGAAGLNHHITVQVQNFAQLLDQQAQGDCRRFVLFIDETPLRGVEAQSCNRYDGTLRFLLDRVPGKNDDEWHQLLGGPTSFVRPVHVSIGVDDQFYIPSSVTRFPLLVIPKVQFGVFVVVLLMAVILFVLLCRRTSIIRNPVAPTAGARPYSLSRFQMAFWLFLVVAGYVFMWLITGDLDTITQSVLALIGIGAGTALGAALIDTSPAPAQPGETPQPPLPPPPSQGFLRDVITDSSGAASIQRFQMFVWTLILGVIFCASVYHDLAMPEFSATLLALMGVSSGTYLGFKFPEKRQAAAAGKGTTD